ARLIELARAGHFVVRLKGGDPFVFGRGGEELAQLALAGIDVIAVPGVSAAFAAPESVGVPVTMRGLASSVAITTAQGGGSPARLEALALALVSAFLVLGGSIYPECFPPECPEGARCSPVCVAGLLMPGSSPLAWAGLMAASLAFGLLTIGAVRRPALTAILGLTWL